MTEAGYRKQQIHQRFEALVFMVLSTRRTLWPAAERLAAHPRHRVDLILEEVRRLTETSVELAFHVGRTAADSLAHLADEDLASWSLHLLETYDRAGIQGCINALHQVEAFAAEARLSRSGQRFEEVAPVLERFVTGLAGRNLRLAADADSYTDTETLFLPHYQHQYPSHEQNFLLYKARVAFLWAQGWYGTWRVPLTEVLAGYADAERARRLFGALEAIRLGACLARDLPGLWRAMRALGNRADEDWGRFTLALRAATTGVETSLKLLQAAYAIGVDPAPLPYQGELFPERVAEAAARRALREKAALQEALAVLADEQGGDLRREGMGETRFETRRIPNPDWPDSYAFQLVLGDQVVMPGADVQQLLDSVVQDFGHIPPDYLTAAGQGRYHRKRGADRAAAAQAQSPGADDALYNEWDYRRQTYRRNWCRVRERAIHPRPDDLVERALAKHRGLLKHLYRTFEALRREDRSLRRQPDGEAPDIDGIVEAHTDLAAGIEPDQRLFLKKQRTERHIAVLFMVDMSGSTKGWINEVEREALVLLCEALERLGDRYAICGFSGYTHLRCEVFRVKDFAERNDASVRSRIASIRPQDYTRMGAVIRHLSRKLLAVEARTRILIALSDGRPDDEDGYRGDYGIEDTRQAILEARNQGIHPFCITIDDQAQDYLPHMFGRAHYTVVEDVAKLPYKVSDIYRRITV